MIFSCLILYDEYPASRKRVSIPCFSFIILSTPNHHESKHGIIVYNMPKICTEISCIMSIYKHGIFVYTNHR